MWSIKHIGRKKAGVYEQDNSKWLPPNMEWTILNNPSYIEGFMPLQPKKVDNAHGASKLYNLPGFLDSDKTMQLLLLGAIVLYSSLPTLPQSTYNRRLAKNTSYLLCVTMTVLVTIICICVCNDLPKKSFLLTILILTTLNCLWLSPSKVWWWSASEDRNTASLDLLHRTKLHPS